MILDVSLEIIILGLSSILFYQFDIETVGAFGLLLFGSVAMVHVTAYEGMSVSRLDDPATDRDLASYYEQLDALRADFDGKTEALHAFRKMNTRKKGLLNLGGI